MSQSTSYRAGQSCVKFIRTIKQRVTARPITKSLRDFVQGAKDALKEKTGA